MMATVLRAWTRKLMEAVDEGMLDANTVLLYALNHMSEDDVRDLCEANELLPMDDGDDDPDASDLNDEPIGD